MRYLEYEDLRRLLVECMEDAGLFVKVDEVLYLGELTRVCELFVQRSEDEEGTWAKIGFEWRAENQAAAQFIEEVAAQAPDLPYAPHIMLHAAFHLHFDDLNVDADVIREVTDRFLAQARHLFGDSGAMVAELRMHSSAARIDCLRYEIDIDAPVDETLEWWQTLGNMCASLLAHLDAIHAELYSRYGPYASN